MEGAKMAKKKTFEKQEFSWEDMPILGLNKKEKNNVFDYKPEETFLNHEKVANALLECLADNDTEAFMEILDSYLRVNRKEVAKKAKMSRSTVQQAFSKSGNPTLKTIAKIVHEAVGSTSSGRAIKSRP
jgi:probable addiction module antidote protein